MADPTPPAQDSRHGERTLYVVATVHLDTQWRWTIQDTIRAFVPATLEQNFEHLENHSFFVVSFEGAFRYMLMKEYYPEEYEHLKGLVETGRWCLAGSMLDAPDVNVVSPESLIRHILYGNGFFSREFGRQSTDLFLPACFGFGWALPSIAAHCGLVGADSPHRSSAIGWHPPPFPSTSAGGKARTGPASSPRSARRAMAKVYGRTSAKPRGGSSASTRPAGFAALTSVSCTSESAIVEARSMRPPWTGCDEASRGEVRSKCVSPARISCSEISKRNKSRICPDIGESFSFLRMAPVA